jgi:hypothetical protein
MGPSEMPSFPPALRRQVQQTEVGRGGTTHILLYAGALASDIQAHREEKTGVLTHVKPYPSIV